MPLRLSFAGSLRRSLAQSRARKPCVLTMDAIFGRSGPESAPLDASSGSSLNKVEVVSSHAIPDMPGKRVTVVRVTYGPGGFTPPHRHGGTVTAYITKGQIRSQLNDGPVEIFDVGQSFFEPPGTIHRRIRQREQHRLGRTDCRFRR